MLFVMLFRWIVGLVMLGGFGGFRLHVYLVISLRFLVAMLAGWC